MSHSHSDDQTSRHHRLWWRPGTRGRGVLFESGAVHTWPEHEGSHRQRAELVGSRPLMFFYVRTDGRVRIPERHAHRAAHISTALRAADPRLTPFAPTREPAPHHEGGPLPEPVRSPCHAASPGGDRGKGHRRTVDHLWEAGAAARSARIRRRY